MPPSTRRPTGRQPAWRCLARPLLAVSNALRRVATGGRTAGNPFDSLAATWDADPARIARAERVAAAIRERIPPGGTWLDFGAGTGLLGLALLGHADHMVLADTSPGMLARAADKIAGLPDPSRASVLRSDLAEGPGMAATYQAVVSLLALHHLPDPATGLARLAELVRPGGRLALCDLDPERGAFHARAATAPAHHGIDRDWLGAQLVDLGLTEVALTTVATIRRHDRDFPLFLAVARKPGNRAAGPAGSVGRRGAAR